MVIWTGFGTQEHCLLYSAISKQKDIAFSSVQIGQRRTLSFNLLVQCRLEIEEQCPLIISSVQIRIEEHCHLVQCKLKEKNIVFVSVQLKIEKHCIWFSANQKNIAFSSVQIRSTLLLVQCKLENIAFSSVQIREHCLQFSANQKYIAFSSVQIREHCLQFSANQKNIAFSSVQIRSTLLLVQCKLENIAFSSVQIREHCLQFSANQKNIAFSSVQIRSTLLLVQCKLENIAFSSVQIRTLSFECKPEEHCPLVQCKFKIQEHCHLMQGNSSRQTIKWTSFSSASTTYEQPLRTLIMESYDMHSLQFNNPAHIFILTLKVLVATIDALGHFETR